MKDKQQLKDKVWEEYKRIWQSARDEYEKQCRFAWKEYRKKQQPAQKKYEKRCQEIDKIK